MENEKKFKSYDDLEEFKEKLLDKYWIIKTEVLIINNWYLLRRHMPKYA